jgi:CDP-diacylglycerol--glycerol-3-phosphate 3-phosphatidyltransferase
MQLTIPNILTLFRISLIPVFVLCFYLPFKFSYIATAVIFVIAGITDWLDGFLARKLKQFSAFGEFLDPVADKLVVAVALVLLVGAYGTAVIAIPAAIIVGREIAISALREWMAEIGKRTNVAVSYVGKVKTASQMAAITCLLSQPAKTINFITITGFVLLYIAAALTIWSMCAYLKAAKKDLEA